MLTYRPRPRIFREPKIISATRIAASNTSWNLRQAAPVGTTHVDIEAIGGGASGVSLRRVAGNPSSHGGFPGLVHRRRFTLAELLALGDLFEILVGAGGLATEPTQDLASVPAAANRAGGTSVVRPIGSGANLVFAPGGPSYWTQSAYYSTPADLLGIIGADYLPSLPGAGYVQQLSGSTPTGPQTGGMSASVAVRGPGAGGGSCDASFFGSGGNVRRYYPNFANTGASTDPGGYGAGGRGGTRFGPGLAGFSPGGGGGGGFGHASGAGAPGAVDFFFLGGAR